MQRLRDAWAEVAKQDRSAPLMKNTDVVYAGMTYGKHDVLTGSSAAGTNRGYLVYNNPVVSRSRGATGFFYVPKEICRGSPAFTNLGSMGNSGNLGSKGSADLFIIS